MKIKFISLFVALTLGITVGALAQSSITINFDETGNASIVTSSGGATPVPFAKITDPGPGGLPNALTYTLPSGFNPVAGDVKIAEPPSTSQFSDVVRFNPSGPGGPATIVVYSDVSPNDPKDSKADIGLPTSFYTNLLQLAENGPNGAPFNENGQNGLYGYTPTSTQPGFIPGFNVTYNFTSDLPTHVGVNKDFINNTGQTTTGFQWLVQGSFTSVLTHYDGPYPGQANSTFSSFTITPSGANTLFSWSGTAAIPPGGKAHVGIVLASSDLITLGVNWTIGGAPAGCVNQVPIGQGHSHFIVGGPGQVAFENVAQSCQPGPLTVGNVTLLWYSEEVPLANLNSQLISNSSLPPLLTQTVPGTTLIAPGGEAIVPLPAGPAGANFVVVEYAVSTSSSLTNPTNDYAQYQVATNSPVPVFGRTGLILLMLLVAGSGIYFIRMRAGKVTRSTG